MQRGAVSLGVVSTVVIAIILIIGFGAYLTTTLNATSTSTNTALSTASTSTNEGPTITGQIISTTCAGCGSGSFSSSVTSSSPNNLAPQTVQTTNSTLGLELLLSVNSNIIPSEDAINVSVSIVNTLSTVNNLTASDDWAIQGLTSSSCNYGNSANKLFSPAGIDVFRGYYGMNNLSSGNPLQIWAEIECPVDYAFNGTSIVGQLQNITSYSFLPGNDGGYYSAYYSSSATIMKGIFPTRMVNGAAFYASNSTGGPYNSLLFSLPGTYTLVAGDEWGQIVLLHFAVTQSNNLLIVGEFLSSPSSGGCTVNGNPVPCITSEFSQSYHFQLRR